MRVIYFTQDWQMTVKLIIYSILNESPPEFKQSGNPLRFDFGHGASALPLTSHKRLLSESNFAQSISLQGTIVAALLFLKSTALFLAAVNGTESGETSASPPS